MGSRPTRPTPLVRLNPKRCSSGAVSTSQPSPSPVGAWAVIKHDTPQILLAENAQVISRLIALKVVASSDPSVFKPHLVDSVRDHLLHERWADAVVMWMEATDTFIDVYEEHVPVWTEGTLDAEVASMAIRTSRLFDDVGPA